MADNYWQTFTSGRLSRRRALAGTGSAALGAAFLAACGGGSSGGSKPAGETSTSADKSGLVATPEDTSSKAKPGGTIKTVYTADILHFDALASNSSSTVNDSSVFAYSRLVKF